MALRGVLIGCGYVSRWQLRAWASVPDVTITAVADLREDQAQARAAEFGIPRAYTDYQAMIAAERPDFVDIATPPATHLAMVQHAAANGLPVLCQKPIAPDLAQLEAMIAATTAAGVLFMVNENGRFQPTFRAIKRHLDSGVIGTPFYASFTARKRLSLPQPSFTQTFFATMPRLMIYEMGVHVLDTLRYLFGEARQIYASTHQASPHIAGEDVALAHVAMDGLNALMDLSWASAPAPHTATGQASWTEVRIEGTGGALHLAKDGSLYQQTDAGTEVEQMPSDSIQQGYNAAQQHFIDCLREGTTPETDGPQTLRTMELVFGAYHAAAQGTVYRVGLDRDALP